jgi:hypothetical protein
MVFFKGVLCTDLAISTTSRTTTELLVLVLVLVLVLLLTFGSKVTLVNFSV